MSSMTGTHKHADDDLCTMSPDYIQITMAVFERLPKLRPPFALHAFLDEALKPEEVHRPGERVTLERHESMRRLCRQGMLFISRQDHGLYKDLLAEHPDLLPLDPGLNGSERAELFARALTARVRSFFAQPSPAACATLRDGVLVLTSHLYADRAHLAPFFANLDGDHSLPWHSFKAMILGLAAFMKLYEGRYNRRHLDDLALGLLLHDAGMTRIPGFVVNKPTALQILEFEKVKRHPSLSVEILRNAGVQSMDILNCASQHHERLDGSGYPLRMRGAEVTILGRIAAVADSLAAMTTDRPHAQARGLEDSLHELARNSRCYDSKVAKALLVHVLTELA